ncbi:MAG: glycoside hydrolase family 97 protein [Bacteroidales bacterium]|nr:glycoside hydrolase family 97 protein [Bacteroidales bacterium]
MNIKSFASIILFVLVSTVVFSQRYFLISPDSNILVEVYHNNEEVSFQVMHNREIIISKGNSSLEIDSFKSNRSTKTDNYKRELIKEEIIDPIPVKFAKSQFEYYELKLSLNESLTWHIRASNDGFAFRWIIESDTELIINNEILSLELAEQNLSYFPKEDGFISHYERLYKEQMVDSIPKNDICSLPVLFQNNKASNILITEADLYDYPGMFLQKTNRPLGFKAVFPKVVLKTKPAERGPDRNEIILEEADYIASTNGSRTLPWRVFALASNDKDLVINNLVYQLSSPLKLENTDWIKPGKVAWDWWNANNIYGVDFESGINNATYKYYIDFAAKYGLEYIILDEGWSTSTTEIMEYQKDIDVQELVAYGKERNVGIILWTLWGPLDKNMKEVLSLYESWGVKGVKVDFMQRADQYMVNYYERVAREAAKRHLLVDFHGAFKPAGLRRAYPNVVNYEGLKGLENVKWSNVITPEHNLTLPFIRMVAGPMDYTPGAMDNAHENNFAIRWHRPMSMGTRCHQVAMYVVYESPLQMLCDNPSNYYREHETTEFISKIPTTWDETIILEAKIGAYVLIARRNGNTWYIGGMTVEAQELQVDLSFLEDNNYQINFIQDGVNSDKIAQDYSMGEKAVSKKSTITVTMNKGGGYTAIILMK